MNKIKLAFVGIGLLLFVGPQLASATIIDFEELSSSGNGSICIGTTYISEGYSFSVDNGQLCFIESNSFYFKGSTGIHHPDDGMGGPTIIQNIDGDSFDLVSIDVTVGVYNPVDEDWHIYFTALNSNGETITQNLLLPLGAPTTFRFGPEFSNLVSMSWNLGGAIYNQIDNLIVYPAGSPIPDSDGDDIPDYMDNCPTTYNQDQTDSDGNGVGDACNDTNDLDNDEYADNLDNCPTTYNQDQTDSDGNGVGDACNDSEDLDNDEYADNLDNCPNDFNDDQTDSDFDGIGDACDPFPYDSDHERAQLEADLAQAQEDLFQAQTDLYQAQSDLAQAQSDLAQCTNNYAQCQSDLTQCSNGYSQCSTDLSQCSEEPPTGVEGPGQTCNDGADNDGDELIDCADPDCANKKDCGSGGEDPTNVEGKGQTCFDGFDNDGDGLIDCDDEGCASKKSCQPSSCDSSDVTICITSGDCTAAGGYWWSDNTCMGVPESETVVSAGGRIWMDRNLGASQVATSSTDSLAYGNLYQWGRGADGHQIRTSGTTSTPSSTDAPGHGDFILFSSEPGDWRAPQNDNLWQGVSGTNNPCPDGFRLPTDIEWGAEMTSWSSKNSAGAFESSLKLVVAGYRYYDGTFQYDDGDGDIVGRYWSSSVSGIYVRRLFLGGVSASMSTTHRAHGFSVRCIKD